MVSIVGMHPYTNLPKCTSSSNSHTFNIKLAFWLMGEYFYMYG